MYGQDFIANGGCSNVPSFFVVFQQRLVSASFYHWRDSHEFFQMHWLYNVPAPHCKDSFSVCWLNLWLARCFFVLNVLSHNEQGISSSMWTSLLCWVSVFWDLNCLPHTLQTKSQIIIVKFGLDPTQASVSLRLTLKLWNFHFSDDWSNLSNARPLIEISGLVFFFGISEDWKGR